MFNKDVADVFDVLEFSDQLISEKRALNFYLSTGRVIEMQDRGTATRERILDIAQTMIQEKGYNAVSFRDLSAVVKVKSASIHYYFPSKEDLGEALVARYRAFFTAGRAALDQKELSPARKLKQYVEVLRTAFRQTGHMCLCGVLAAEMSSLPERVAEGVRAFFTENEEWLAGVLARGRSSGELRFSGAAERSAEAVFASLEGALMSAWTFKDENRIAAVGKLVVESLLRGE
jgi:TetR/AcrR family transcriptional repressor of nem operon